MDSKFEDQSSLIGEQPARMDLLKKVLFAVLQLAVESYCLIASMHNTDSIIIVGCLNMMADVGQLYELQIREDVTGCNRPGEPSGKSSHILLSVIKSTYN